MEQLQSTCPCCKTVIYYRTCSDCKHYRRHYVALAPRFIPTVFGHCVSPRIKQRAAQQSACVHWEAIKEVT